MDRNELLKGKEISVYFDDGSRITRKDGVVLDISESALFFKERNQVQVIPFSRIIRIEEKSHSGGN